MRKLDKSDAPPILSEHEAEWTTVYLRADKKGSPWARPEIKRALIEETSGKCAYCEGTLLSVSFGDIEHIRPKSVFPELVVSWANLTLACSRCNSAKSSKYDPDLEWINPYVDDPADHIMFLGPFAYPLTDRGSYAIQELDLNNVHRVEARNEAINTAALVVNQIESASTSYTREALRQVLRRIETSGPYSVAVTSYTSSGPIASRLQLT